MSRYHKSECFTHSAHLRYGEPLANHLQEQINPRIDNKKILDLAARPGQSRCQPLLIRLMSACQPAQRVKCENHCDRVEVPRVVRQMAPLQRQRHREKQQGGGDQPEIEFSGSVSSHSSSPIRISVTTHNHATMTAKTSENTDDFANCLSHTYTGSDRMTAHQICAFVVCLNVFEMRPSNSQFGFAAALVNK